jgi:putative transposase
MRPEGIEALWSSPDHTFAWLSFNCRLNRDYEFLPETSETFICTAMIRFVVRRFAS